MCGIAGFFDQKDIVGLETLQDMTARQAHRGPDAEGNFFELLGTVRVALGHRRLSIIDRSTGANQPMIFEHLALVYNGEVYNFVEIKKELQGLGYAFHTDSDTEVVLKAFHCWGISSVARFRGMFAFCIVDTKIKKAFLVRDRAGVKPFYYYADGQHFIFASELKSLHCHPGFKKDLCERGLNLYFQYGYIAAPWTIFQRTQKICPGCYIEYDLTANTYEEKKYWDLSSYYKLSKVTTNEQEITEQLHAMLAESFALRMVSDVPVGVLLSGGIDSSLVAAILQKQSPRPIETFTIGFDQQEFDESIHAREVARYLGTNHHEKKCTWKEAEAIIPLLSTMYDEPFADISSIPTALVAQFAKQSVSVALSGDGGDEMFCGYTYYARSEKRFNKLANIPFKKTLGKMLELIPDPMMKMYQVNFDLYNRYLKLKSIFLQEHTEEKFKAITRTYTSYDIDRLIVNNSFFSLKPEIFKEIGALERMMLTDFNHYLPDDLLVKVDRATMYYSLEGREPLLDHKLLEYAAQLPIHLKNEKYILKKILTNYLPAAYFERKKQGFGVPIQAWLRKELKHLLDKYLESSKIIKQGVFDHRYISKLCQSFLRSKTNDNRIWTLLMFQMWYEEHMDAIF